MNIGDIVTVEITGISHQGAGIGRSDGMVVFVPEAMLGETVTVQIVEYKKKMATAKLIEVLLSSVERRTPCCVQSENCGGCELQHCSAAYQMQTKQQVVQDAMTRLGHIAIPVQPVLGMEEPWRYRNKGIFHADYQNGNVRLGFYKRGSHQFVPAEACMLFSAEVNTLVVALERWIQESGRAFYIKKVMIRESHTTGEQMVVFVTEDPAWRLQELSQKTITLPQVVSVYHNVNTNPKLMLGRKFCLLEGRETIIDNIGPFQFRISPQSFFQVNAVQTEVLYRTVLQYARLTGTEIVADVYCGIGSISLYLAQQAKEVIGIESVAQAVQDAKENAKRNGMSNTTFIAAKAEDWLPKWVKQGNQLDVAIIDPPRKGCETSVLDALVVSGAKRIVYVSCNPSTLARDAKYLCLYGYEVQAIQPVDLFCQSWHVETCVLLGRKIIEDKNVEYEHVDYEPKDAEYMRGTKGSATYAEIKKWIKEQYNVSVSSLYIAQVKDACGFEKRENYNTGAEGHKVPQCPKEKREMIMEAFKHFRMI